MTNSKKIAFIIVACVFAAICLTVCQAVMKPHSAQEVFDRYSAGNYDNFTVSGMVNVTVSSQGSPTDTVSHFNLETNGRATHRVLNKQLNYYVNQFNDTYIVDENGKLVSYSRKNLSGAGMSGGDNTWIVADAPDMGIGDVTEFDPSMFENAELRDAADGYEVVVQGGDFMQYVKEQQGNNDMTSPFGIYSIPESYAVVLESAEVVFSFDKDCKLIRIDIPGVSGPVGSDDEEVTVSIVANLNFANYGEVKNIVLPESIPPSEGTPSSESGADSGSSAASEPAAPENAKADEKASAASEPAESKDGKADEKAKPEEAENAKADENASAAVKPAEPEDEKAKPAETENAKADGEKTEKAS